MERFEDRDSRQLGSYREWRASGALADICDAVWVYEAGETPLPHRLLADRQPSIVIQARRDRADRLVDMDLRISGSRNRADWYRPAPGDLQIGVRLLPEVSGAALGVCPKEFETLQGELPPALRTMLEAAADLALQSSLRDGASLLARHCLQIARPARTRVSIRAARLIRTRGGRYPIARLARELEVSERQLAREFKAVTGLSPKAYSRLVRHVRAMTLADDSPAPDWAGIAIEAGYFDQSHMVRDMLALTGTSPARLHAERRAESEISNTRAA